MERLKAVDQLRDCTEAQLEEVARLADRLQVGEGEVILERAASAGSSSSSSPAPWR